MARYTSRAKTGRKEEEIYIYLAHKKKIKQYYRYQRRNERRGRSVRSRPSKE